MNKNGKLLIGVLGLEGILAGAFGILCWGQSKFIDGQRSKAKDLDPVIRELTMKLDEVKYGRSYRKYYDKDEA